MYKNSYNGVIDLATGKSIPEEPDNKDWQKYIAWLAEGNTAEPQFTQEQLDQFVLDEEKETLTLDLKKALAWQFRMLLELFEVGKTKGLWINTDFDATLRAKAVEWKTKLDRLTELGE